MTERKSVRNYTTEAQPERSAGEVLGLLSRYGAREVNLTYRKVGDVQRPVGVAFALDAGYGERRYQLPVRHQVVLAKMQADVKLGRIPRGRATEDQALRTAWRNVRDLLDAVLSTTETGQLKADEVLFPFLEMAEGATIYEAFVDRELKALGTPKP